jgi:peptidyl-tRNA hydrolase
VRFGIGRPLHAGEVTNYVLGDFDKDEWAAVEKTISLLAAEASNLLEGREDLVMSNIARTA